MCLFLNVYSSFFEKYFKIAQRRICFHHPKRIMCYAIPCMYIHCALQLERGLRKKLFRRWGGRGGKYETEIQRGVGLQGEKGECHL